MTFEECFLGTTNVIVLARYKVYRQLAAQEARAKENKEFFPYPATGRTKDAGSGWYPPTGRVAGEPSRGMGLGEGKNNDAEMIARHRKESNDRVLRQLSKRRLPPK